MIRHAAWVTAVLLPSAAAVAQTSTGTLSGRVTSAGDGLPGVTVTVTSTSLQGRRSAITSASGGYLVPGLPGGTYTVRFDLPGFTTLDQQLRISAAQLHLVDAVMAPTSVSGEIDVAARYETVGTASTGAETVEQSVLERLPADRSLESAVDLVAGTAATGPRGQTVISGSQSFENLYTMNGIVLNETIRQQPSSLYIEDAIEQTTVLSTGVTAEYGRFSGGVANMITKSGGNRFAGSVRVGLENDAWTASGPLDVDRVDRTNAALEATLGGYLWKDRLWFFLAGRDQTLDRSRQTHVSQIPFVQTFDDRRLEAKLTALAGRHHRVTATLSRRTWPNTNGDFAGFPAMDLRGLDPSYGRENRAFAVNYSAALSDAVFLEAQYSQHDFTIVDVGGDDPSLDGGTPVLDFLRQGSFHAPFFCGLPCRDEERDNRNALAKLWWSVDAGRAGTHDLVFGLDSFTDRVLYDNHQSASDYQLWTLTEHDFSTGTPLVNVQPFAAVIAYRGLTAPAQRTDFRTDSAYVNDTWRVSDRLTVNLGLRYDASRGTDSGGARVIDQHRWSPRLGASWDASGDGRWIVNASAGRYTSAVVYTIANSAAVGGRPVEITYLYTGPPVLAAEVGGNQAAVARVFDWFFNVYGGLDNPANLFQSPVIPGLTPQIADDLRPSSVDELSVGFALRLGDRGVLRADYVHREYGDFYAGETVPNRWVESELTGPVDLTVIRNENDLLERRYDGLLARFQYRVDDRWILGGSWTWSHAIGTWDGESAGDSAFAGDVTEYREYKDPAWSSPRGDLAVDQRHKLRLWGIWTAISSRRHTLSVSLLQRVDSGTPYSAVGVVDNSLGLESVGNPGYITPPSLLDYYFSPRGAFTTDAVTSTDLALNYSFIVATGSGDLELFIQPEVRNLFDQHAVVGVDTTVFTSESDPALQPFDPLRETPIEGVHWRPGDDFGRPTRDGHYQRPRTFRVSLGLRF